MLQCRWITGKPAPDTPYSFIKQSNTMHTTYSNQIDRAPCPKLESALCWPSWHPLAADARQAAHDAAILAFRRPLGLHIGAVVLRRLDDLLEEAPACDPPVPLPRRQGLTASLTLMLRSPLVPNIDGRLQDVKQ